MRILGDHGLGTRLRYPLHDASGVLLVAQGTTVTTRLQDLLERRQISLDLRVHLRVLSGGPEGTEIPLTKEHTTIGRRVDCDVPIDCATVSGRHCRMYMRPSGVYVEDLGSRNGTFVNGRRVSGALLELGDNDRLRVGNVVFAVIIFAALAADSTEGNEALDAWRYAALARQGAAGMRTCPTEPEIDLG